MDNANSTQDLNDARSVFRQYSNEFWFSNMDVSIAKSLMKIVNAEFKSKIQVAEELQAKRELPTLTGRQIAFMIYAFFKINDVQQESHWHERLAEQ